MHKDFKDFRQILDVIKLIFGEEKQLQNILFKQQLCSSVGSRPDHIVPSLTTFNPQAAEQFNIFRKEIENENLLKIAVSSNDYFKLNIRYVYFYHRVFVPVLRFRH